MKINITKVEAEYLGPVEVMPCRDCKLFHWTPQESETIKNAIQLSTLFECVASFAYLMEDSDLLMWNEELVDWEAMRSELYELPYRIVEPFELDGDGIRHIKELLLVLAFSGVTDIPIESISSAHIKLGTFARHIEKEHRGTDGEPLVPLRSIDGFIPLIEYSPDFLMHILPYVRGKSVKEIIDYCEKEMNRRKQELGI